MVGGGKEKKNHNIRHKLITSIVLFLLFKKIFKKSNSSPSGVAQLLSINL